MSRWVERSSVGGGGIIVVLGMLYVLLAAVRTAVVVSGGARVPGQLLNLLLVAIPSLALVFCGYRLSHNDVPTDVHLRVAGWSLLGGGVITAVIVVVEFTPGSGIEYLQLAILLFGSLGSLGGFGIGLQEARAITQAREAERQRQEVERYSRELERQNERLESFAGMLAHELRNPLSIAQIYLQRVEGDPDAIADIEDSLERIEEMIDILLVTVRGSEAAIDWQAVALSQIADDAWSDLSPESATLVVETDQTIRADPVHVRHLLKNLFGNAIEHGSSEVTVRVGSLGGDTGFFVEDDGPGIPEDARETVIEAGYTTKAGGIGLGLTFVANLVDAYGWDWTITESQSGGARFEFSGVDVVTEAELQQG